MEFEILPYEGSLIDRVSGNQPTTNTAKIIRKNGLYILDNEKDQTVYTAPAELTNSVLTISNLAESTAISSGRGWGFDLYSDASNYMFFF